MPAYPGMQRRIPSSNRLLDQAGSAAGSPIAAGKIHGPLPHLLTFHGVPMIGGNDGFACLRTKMQSTSLPPVQSANCISEECRDSRGGCQACRDLICFLALKQTQHNHLQVQIGQGMTRLCGRWCRRAQGQLGSIPAVPIALTVSSHTQLQNLRPALLSCCENATLHFRTIAEERHAGHYQFQPAVHDSSQAWGVGSSCCGTTNKNQVAAVLCRAAQLYVTSNGQSSPGLNLRRVPVILGRTCRCRFACEAHNPAYSCIGIEIVLLSAAVHAAQGCVAICDMRWAEQAGLYLRRVLETWQMQHLALPAGRQIMPACHVSCQECTAEGCHAYSAGTRACM